MVENLTIFRQYESAVDHWELRSFCDLASTASTMASKAVKPQLNSVNWPGLQFQVHKYVLNVDSVIKVL